MFQTKQNNATIFTYKVKKMKWVNIDRRSEYGYWDVVICKYIQIKRLRRARAWSVWIGKLHLCYEQESLDKTVPSKFSFGYGD